LMMRRPSLKYKIAKENVNYMYLRICHEYTKFANMHPGISDDVTDVPNEAEYE
jgi:hypothetical protein